MSRRKGPKVEAWAWAVVSDETERWISWDRRSVEYEADSLRDRDDTANVEIIDLVPADPAREAVVRAAVKNAAHLGTGAAALEIRAAVEKLLEIRAAVEKLQRKERK